MPRQRQLNIRTVNQKKNTRGIVQDKPDIFLSPNEAVDIINMHSIKKGEWSADNVGYTKLNENGLAIEGGAAIDGLHWFTDKTYADHLYFACNGKIKEINTGTGAISDIDAAAGFTPGRIASFLTFNYLLYSCDGTVAKPRVWNAATTTAADSAGWPVSDGTNTYATPGIVCSFLSRAAYADLHTGTGAETQYRSHVILSDLGNAESFTLPATAANHGYIVGVGTGDGQRITGMKQLNIPALPSQYLSKQEQLIVAKERSIYTITGQSGLLTDTNVFSCSFVSETFGCFNSKCMIQLGNEILMMNEYGITSVTGNRTNGNILASPIESDLVQDIIARINLGATNKCWGLHLPHRREVMFFIPTGASTVCNEAIVYKYPKPGDQYDTGKWSRRTDVASKFQMSCGILFHRTFYAGNYTGFVNTMFNSSTYDGVAIPWLYEHADFDFGNDQIIKDVVHAEAWFKVRSAQNFTITTIWTDGNNDVFNNPIALNPTVGQKPYGSAHYGQDYYGSAKEARPSFKAPGNGIKLKVILSGNTGATGPSYHGLNFVPQYGAISQRGT